MTAFGEPTLAEVMRLAMDSKLLDTFTALIAQVETYTPGPPGPPTVDAKPMIRRALEDTEGNIVHEELPTIPSVPVVFPHGAAFQMTWPLQVGDHVLVVCTNWSHQEWRETGSLSDPGDLRTHEIGNAFAIAGVLPKSGTMPTSPTAAVLEVVAPATHVQIGALLAEFVGRADKIEQVIGDLATEILTATPTPNDGGAAIQTAAKAALALLGWTGGGTVPPAGSTAATKLKSE